MDKNEFNEAMESIRAKHVEVGNLDRMLDGMGGIDTKIISLPTPIFTTNDDGKKSYLILESSNPNFIRSIQSIYRNELVRQRNALHTEIADLMSRALEFLPGGKKGTNGKLAIVGEEKTEKGDKE